MGAIDWSGEPVEGLNRDALDSVEVARLRNILRAARPQSDLLTLHDENVLAAGGLLSESHVSRAGLLLVGRRDVLARALP